MSSVSTSPRGTGWGPDELRLKHYLLDQLSRDERAQLEREYFEDDNQFGALLTVEDALVNAYIDQELAQDERQVFERTFLATPAGRERVRLARSLRGAITRLDPDERGASAPAAAGAIRSPAPSLGVGLRWTLAAAAGVVFSVGLWGLSEMTRVRNEMERVTATRETLQRDVEAAQQQAQREQARADHYRDDLQRLQSSVPSPTAKPGAPRLVTLSLLPVTTLRAGGVEPVRLALGSDHKVVELELAVDVPRGTEAFRIVVEEDGRTIAQFEQSKSPTPGPGIITAPLPAFLLNVDRLYTVRLDRIAGQSAPQTVHRYAFRVGRP